MGTPEQEDRRRRRLAEALDALWTAMGRSGPIEELWPSALSAFMNLAGADVGVLRLRDGDQLRPRAWAGLEAGSSAAAAVPVGSVVRRNLAVELGDHLKVPGVRGLGQLPLLDRDEVFGLITLGTRRGRELTADHLEAVCALAVRTQGALHRHIEFERIRDGLHARDHALGVVAHDLRNPIAVIAMAANNLSLRLQDPAARQPLERILRGAQRADRLIQDLLDVSAIESGRFAIQASTVETANTILAAVESQQTLAASASIIIATDVSPGLPPIWADDERIEEVLENLVGNAIKFTAPGGSVTVGASAKGESDVLFWVKDSGEGIPQEHLPFLFDRYWQSRKDDRRGAGLGLTICKAIVEAHGGRIWADTAVGAGTTMFFTIPAQVATSEPEALEVANILLVDDRPENLTSLKAILDRPDYRLVTASSGEEALALALRERFAVALLDIAMPGMNGLEVAVHMKALERSRATPIIFITAYGNDPQEIHRAYSAGGADYLVKPLDSEIVRKKVAVFVDLTRKRKVSQSQNPPDSKGP